MKRWRHLLTAIFISPFLFMYALGVAYLSDFILDLHPVLDIIFFLFAGLLWLVPASKIVAWLARNESH